MLFVLLMQPQPSSTALFMLHNSTYAEGKGIEANPETLNSQVRSSHPSGNQHATSCTEPHLQANYRSALSALRHWLCKDGATQRTIKTAAGSAVMDSTGSQSWLQSFLHPAGYKSTSENSEAGMKQVKPRDCTIQQQVSTGATTKARPAFNDITNNETNGKLGLDKVKGAGFSAQQQPILLSQHIAAGKQQSLPQQTFSDPSLIDSGAHHADRKLRNWVDVDATNMDDPQACAPYANAIFQHLRETEKLKRANPHYLEQYQQDMNSKMRAILVDWLVEVAEEYKLCADTLYLTVNYVDRFLSKQIVPRAQLQLVGVACMWVAAKFEEIYPPNVSDFCYITDSTYSKKQLVNMEEAVLKKLQYELSVPTAKTFLRRLLQVCKPDEMLHFLSNYLTELSLLDHVMMQYLPSQIAAAAVYLANLMLRRQPWDGTLEHYSTYSGPEVVPCARALADLHHAVTSNAQLAAIKEKYAHPKFQSVSRLPISGSVMQSLK